MVLGAVLIILFIGYVDKEYKTENVSMQNINSKKDSLAVSTSFYPLFFFTSQIIGTTSDQLYVITPPHAEPHEYEPTAENIRNIQSSKLLITIGTYFEPWLSKLSLPSSTTLITVGNGLVNQKYTDEDNNSVQDPHIWLSPKNAIIITQKITQSLTDTDPKHANDYVMNSKKLITDLQTLDTEYASGLSSCEKKDIITSHSAFGYLAQDYDLIQKGISGLSPEAEPTPKEFAHIIEFAKTNKVKVIFFESTVSPKLSQTIAKEIGAQTMILDPIEGISEDAQAKGENYFSIMRKNLVNLRVALECK